MDIFWHGYACLSLDAKEASVVINPYSSSIGLKLPSLTADAVLVSQQDADIMAFDRDDVKILDWPGEYEVCGVAITSQKLKPKPTDGENGTDTTLFTLNVDNLKICYFDNLGVDLTQEMVENIGQVDILMIPVGTEKNAYKKAHEIIEEIEPRIVIPMLYRTDGLNVELESIENFAKQAGITALQPSNKFSINAKSDLPQEQTQYVILIPKTVA